MAEFPALPLWTDAYLGDTTHLTAEEHGVYLLLLIVAWRSPDTALPNDDKLLARYARLTPRKWKSVKSVVMPFFKETEDGKLVQNRLLDEMEKCVEKSRAASKAGKASAASRRQNRQKRTNRDDKNEATEKQNESGKPLKTNERTSTERQQGGNVGAAIPEPEPESPIPASDSPKSARAGRIGGVDIPEGAFHRALQAAGMIERPVDAELLHEWLAIGCDLETVILPTLREHAARYSGGRIRKFRFFDRAVREAKAEAEADLKRREKNRVFAKRLETEGIIYDDE